VSAAGASAGLLIELEGVQKRYATGRTAVDALRGIDLRVERGEFVAMMGPSGSWKTTLLEILGCLSPPTAGRYTLAGRPVESIPPDRLARLRGEEIGFIFQAFNLLPRLSALENAELPLVYRRVPRRERRERARDALARVGLEGRERHLPGELSGGERQRVAVARALINRPQLVLADEPTGNLDTATGEGIMDLLTGLHDEGHTLVVVTHDTGVGERAGRRLELRDGRVADDRTGSAA